MKGKRAHVEELSLDSSRTEQSIIAYIRCGIYTAEKKMKEYFQH